MHFADRLAQAVSDRGTPVLVGLDPRHAQLPDPVRPPENAARETIAQSYEQFCCGVIDAVADQVAVVKPQSAFFEQLGPAGGIALANVIRYAREQNLLVILDGKRNDIGSTATAYAAAYLGADSAWGADALTVSPYLGDDSLTPFVDRARAADAGIFVLVKTSNPGGGAFQDKIAEGEPIYAHVAQHVEALAADTAGDCGYGLVGAVVGATYPDQLRALRQAMPHAWLLVPGFGAQGGRAADVAGAFDEQGRGAVINSSRAIIFAHARPEYARFGAQRWQDAVREATLDMRAELASAIGDR